MLLTDVLVAANGKRVRSLVVLRNTDIVVRDAGLIRLRIEGYESSAEIRDPSVRNRLIRKLRPARGACAARRVINLCRQLTEVAAPHERSGNGRGRVRACCPPKPFIIDEEEGALATVVDLRQPDGSAYIATVLVVIVQGLCRPIGERGCRVEVGTSIVFKDHSVQGLAAAFGHVVDNTTNRGTKFR